MADALLVALMVATDAPLACAYMGLLPRGLGKTPDGRRRLWGRLAFAPYFALNGVTFWLYCRVARGPASVRVAPNLWLGRRLSAREFALGNWHGVLDLAAEFEATPPARAAKCYRSLPLLDRTAPTPDQLSEALAFLADATATGPVYLHCALGHGRSACVAAAHLVATGRAVGATDAVRNLKRLRPGVRLHRGQMRAVRGVRRAQ